MTKDEMSDLIFVCLEKIKKCLEMAKDSPDEMAGKRFKQTIEKFYGIE